MSELFVCTQKYGDLEYDEIFLYYDGPCIFSVKNKLGYRFICLLETETDEINRYIVAPVSVARYNEFVKNVWPIRFVFTKAEQGGVFSVSFGKEGTSISDLTIGEIETMNLPDEKEMLEYNGGYTANEILFHSAEQDTPILQKSLEKNGEHRQYIYAGELAKESLKFQKVFDGIARDAIEQLPNSSKEQVNRIKKACQVPIYGTFAASFGIHIESTEYARIGETETDFEKYMKVYFDLLKINENTEQSYFEAHKNALIALRSYYKTLISLDFALKIVAATPNHDYYKFHMSREELIYKYGFLNFITDDEMEQVVLDGVWTEINIEKKTFKFKTNNGESIIGKFDDDFDESIFDFANEIKILVDKRKSTARIGDETERYTLLSIVST